MSVFINLLYMTARLNAVSISHVTRDQRFEISDLNGVKQRILERSQGPLVTTYKITRRHNTKDSSRLSTTKLCHNLEDKETTKHTVR
jgi:hypothetical protein